MCHSICVWNLSYEDPEICTQLMRVEKHMRSYIGERMRQHLRKNNERQCKAQTEKIFWMNCVKSTRRAKAGHKSGLQSNCNHICRTQICSMLRDKCRAGTLLLQRETWETLNCYVFTPHCPVMWTHYTSLTSAGQYLPLQTQIIKPVTYTFEKVSKPISFAY